MSFLSSLSFSSFLSFAGKTLLSSFALLFLSDFALFSLAGNTLLPPSAGVVSLLPSALFSFSFFAGNTFVPPFAGVTSESRVLSVFFRSLSESFLPATPPVVVSTV